MTLNDREKAILLISTLQKIMVDNDRDPIDSEMTDMFHKVLYPITKISKVELDTILTEIEEAHPLLAQAMQVWVDVIAKTTKSNK